MNGIAAFLNARLDEEEREAEYALERLSECAGIQVSDPDDGGDIGHMVAYSFHALRHNPARVLREVEAKRVILEWHYPGLPWAHDAPEGLEICAGEEGDGDTWQMATRWPCPQIRALAAIWSGHPDYDPDWALGAAVTT